MKKAHRRSLCRWPPALPQCHHIHTSPIHEMETSKKIRRGGRRLRSLAAEIQIIEPQKRSISIEPQKRSISLLCTLFPVIVAVVILVGIEIGVLAPKVEPFLEHHLG